MIKVAATLIFAVFIPANEPATKAIDVQCGMVSETKMCAIPAAQLKALIEHNNAASKEVDRLRNSCRPSNDI